MRNVDHILEQDREDRERARWRIYSTVLGIACAVLYLAGIALALSLGRGL